MDNRREWIEQNKIAYVLRAADGSVAAQFDISATLHDAMDWAEAHLVEGGLRAYVQHKESCDLECLMEDEHPSCTCGLMEALSTRHPAPPPRADGGLLTHEEFTASLDCLIACYPDGCRYEYQRNIWKQRLLAAYYATVTPAPVKPGGVRETNAKTAICEEILDIMRVYHEQAARPSGVDTPGGLEHMGDVWNLFHRWESTLNAHAPSGPLEEALVDEVMTLEHSGPVLSLLGEAFSATVNANKGDRVHLVVTGPLGKEKP